MFVGLYKPIHLPLTIVASTYVCWFISPSTYMNSYIHLHPQNYSYIYIYTSTYDNIMFVGLCCFINPLTSIYIYIHIHIYIEFHPPSSGTAAFKTNRLKPDGHCPSDETGRPRGGGESDAGHGRLLLRRICLQKGPANGVNVS